MSFFVGQNTGLVQGRESMPQERTLEEVGDQLQVFGVDLGQDRIWLVTGSLRHDGQSQLAPLAGSSNNISQEIVLFCR